MNKIDVIIFAQNAEAQLFTLRDLLKSGGYKHSKYITFYIHDPKKRIINKAIVLDRILHHAVHRIIEPIFDKQFIFDSYSSRKNKGTLKAIERFRNFAGKLSRNNKRTVWVLKCDIKKFFDSVDHGILLGILKRTIKDEKTIDLLQLIINSYEKKNNKDIPLGNLTNQIFSNIYLNELDQYIKRILRVKYYVRYADDFVICDINKQNLELNLGKIRNFLFGKLKLTLHKEKISIKMWHSGTDFLGYVSFPTHTILRTKTKKRILRKLKTRQHQFETGKITKEILLQTVASYRARLLYCSGICINKRINKICKID